MAKAASPIIKKLDLAKAYLTGKPVWCTWQVTYHCNFRCTFCDYWAEHPRRETTLDEFRIGAERLKQFGSLMISLAGGEPLLRKDLPEIVEILAEHHFPFVTTNGWLVTKELARSLWEAGLWGASVSIDYTDPDRHDRERGKEGAFDRAVQAIRFFLEERTASYQRVNLMAVLRNDNLEEMEGLIQLAGRLGCYFMVQPYSAMKTGERRFNPPRGASQYLLRLKRKYRRFISNPYFLSRFDEASNGGVPGCASGYAFFNIDNFCQVSKCVEFRDEPLGKITTEAPRELLQRLRRANRENTCQACWYNCRGEIESLYSLRGLLVSLPIFIKT